jgi:hypothetical protein
MLSYSMLFKFVQSKLCEPDAECQRRNPVRAAIKGVSSEIGDIPADFQVGTHNGVLFLR